MTVSLLNFYPFILANNLYFFVQMTHFWFLGLQGQAEKMLNETKEKVSEYTEAAMEKVNNCKVS